MLARFLQGDFVRFLHERAPVPDRRAFLSFTPLSRAHDAAPAAPSVPACEERSWAGCGAACLLLCFEDDAIHGPSSVA